ncbi:hypothetical protein HGRIS_010695 [Hohenbuehelia grisea]|uniref:Uncharacterized protein n=1 Tax=Hohenbuehelia grisea TaxID=104357 RepID=A0ABR3IXZ9_9AGAR
MKQRTRRSTSSALKRCSRCQRPALTCVRGCYLFYGIASMLVLPTHEGLGGTWKWAKGCRKSVEYCLTTPMAPYVRVVNVTLTRYKPKEILNPFAQCLATLPNLQTINVVHAHTQITTFLKNAFQGVDLPSVRRILLPTQAHEILRCCPNVRRVMCTEGDGSQLLSAIAKNCKSVEYLDNFRLHDDKIIKRQPCSFTSRRFSPYPVDIPGIPKAVPNLQRLDLWSSTSPVSVKTFFVSFVVLMIAGHFFP